MPSTQKSSHPKLVKGNLLELQSSMSIKETQGDTMVKESTCQCRRHKRCRFDPWVRKIPWWRKWQSALVFLPGKFHRQKSLVGFRPWDHKELDTTEHTHTHVGWTYRLAY